MRERKKLNGGDNLVGYVFISPWLLGFLLFSLIPMLASLYYAFCDYDILGSPVFCGGANFVKMMHDKLFWQSLKVTFFYAFVSVPLRLLFAFFIALLFNKGTRAIRVYQAIYYIPSLVGGSIAIAVTWRRLFNRGTRAIRAYQAIYYIPSLVGGSIAIAVTWRRLFMADGAFNAFLKFFGITSAISWIGRPSTAIWTLIILAIWQFGSSMLIFLAGLRQIPKTYYEAAQIDGAGKWMQFLHITLPQITPVIFFNLVMQLINGFTVFTQAFVVSGGSGDPLNSTLVYALYLYQRAFKYYDMGYSSALAWVLVLIIGLFTGLVFKTSNSWVFYEAKEGK